MERVIYFDRVILSCCHNSLPSQPNKNCNEKRKTITIPVPFKDQKSADITTKQQQCLGKKIGIHLQPVFSSHKISCFLKVRKARPDIISQQCVVYYFQCGLCDVDYAGYTNRHLHQRFAERSSRNWTIGKQMHEKRTLLRQDLTNNFSVLERCLNKFDCLIHELLLIKKLKPSL